MFVKRQPHPHHLKSGYLLLEVTLAIAISALILTAMFQIADWNLKVSNEAVNSSNKHMKESAFFSFMDRAFRELPGDAVIELNRTETSTHYLSEMIIQNAGELFSWPNQPFTARAVKIVTKPNRDNTIDILLEYYQEPLISDQNNRVINRAESDQEPLQTLILLDNIWKFQWNVWDGQNLQRDNTPSWEGEWEDAKLPRYLELDLVFDPEERPILHYFWNPQKINPEQHFNQTLNNRPTQQNSGQNIDIKTPVDPPRIPDLSNQ